MRRTSAVSNAVRFLIICLISAGEKRPFSPRSFSSASICKHVQVISSHWASWKEGEEGRCTCSCSNCTLSMPNKRRVVVSWAGPRIWQGWIWLWMSRSWPGREIVFEKKKAGCCCLDCFPFLSTQGRTMPSRGPRPSLVRTHSRSSSGGSSKVVYNLQLTHKDPVVQSKIDKARRTSHTFEVRHCFPKHQLHCIIRTMLAKFCTCYPSIFIPSFLFEPLPRTCLLIIDMGSQIHG